MATTRSWVLDVVDQRAHANLGGLRVLGRAGGREKQATDRGAEGAQKPSLHLKI
jgi:hypothetical protein